MKKKLLVGVLVLTLVLGAFAVYADSPDVFIRVNKTGNFIATVRLTDGKEVRYTVDVKAPPTHMLYYEVNISKMNDSK